MVCSFGLDLVGGGRVIESLSDRDEDLARFPRVFIIGFLPSAATVVGTLKQICTNLVNLSFLNNKGKKDTHCL